jgi:hypothetical protein
VERKRLKNHFAGSKIKIVKRDRPQNPKLHCYLALAFFGLVLACSGCASVTSHWNDPPPNVSNSGWQLISPENYGSFGSGGLKP